MQEQLRASARAMVLYDVCEEILVIELVFLFRGKP
jgi:hypothetical protein